LWRLGKWPAVVPDPGEAHAKIIGLDAAITLAGGEIRSRFDARQQAAALRPFDPEWINRIIELVLGMDLHAIVGLSEQGVVLPANRVGNPRVSHEISLISRVDEHFCMQSQPAEHANGDEAAAFHARRVEVFPAEDPDTRLPHPLVEYVLGHVWLEAPLPGIAVMAADCAVERAGQAAYGCRVSKIRPPEARRADTPKVSAGFQDHNIQAVPCRLDRGGDPG
jgi:hypothetical protein